MYNVHIYRKRGNESERERQRERGGDRNRQGEKGNRSMAFQPGDNQKLRRHLFSFSRLPLLIKLPPPLIQVLHSLLIPSVPIPSSASLFSHSDHSSIHLFWLLFKNVRLVPLRLQRYHKPRTGQGQGRGRQHNALGHIPSYATRQTKRKWKF